jgi:hypothetical protein
MTKSGGNLGFVVFSSTKPGVYIGGGRRVGGIRHPESENIGFKQGDSVPSVTASGFGIQLERTGYPANRFAILWFVV